MVVRRNGWYIMLTVVDYLVIVSLRAALLLTVRESGATRCVSGVLLILLNFATLSLRPDPLGVIGSSLTGH